MEAALSPSDVLSLSAPGASLFRVNPMSDRLGDQLRFMQSSLNVRAYRQQVLAANIANADTPNFKARDLDFKTAMAQVLANGKGGSLPLATTAHGHQEGVKVDPLKSQLKYRNEEQGAVDGNTVNMDVERSEFAENSVQYQASVTFINGLLRTMQQAIQDR